MNISGSYITSSGESSNGNKRKRLLEKLRYDERLACLRSIVILSCHPTYLLMWVFLYISNQDALFAILLHYDSYHDRTDTILYKLEDHF